MSWGSMHTYALCLCMLGVFEGGTSLNLRVSVFSHLNILHSLVDRSLMNSSSRPDHLCAHLQAMSCSINTILSRLPIAVGELRVVVRMIKGEG